MNLPKPDDTGGPVESPAAARAAPLALAWRSGDRCQRCGGDQFWVFRVTAECARCGWPVTLAQPGLVPAADAAAAPVALTDLSHLNLTAALQLLDEWTAAGRPRGFDEWLVARAGAARIARAADYQTPLTAWNAR